MLTDTHTHTHPHTHTHTHTLPILTSSVKCKVWECRCYYESFLFPLANYTHTEWRLSSWGAKHIEILCKGVLPTLHSADTWYTICQSFTKWPAEVNRWQPWRLWNSSWSWQWTRGGCFWRWRPSFSLMILIMNQIRKLLFIFLQAGHSHQKTLRSPREESGYEDLAWCGTWSWGIT